MVDMSILKEYGCSSGHYKRVFSGPRSNYPKRVQQLVDLIANRARRGRILNLKEWRAYAAIDIAYDAPFNQTTPTLIQNVLNMNLHDPLAIKRVLEGWGLREEDLYLRVKVGDNYEGLIPNPPVFFNVIIPLVKAYVTIRLAKLFNERNQNPLLPYEPFRETAKNQVLCEIVTDMVDTVSTWYGYPAVLRQCIQQMLKYGIMLTFPMEEWHTEEQLIEEETQDEFGTSKKVVRDTVKEGLRYHIPHPTRMYYDLQYPLTTLNTDTGVRWCGHWTVQTYGDILDNRNYWNRRSIFSGTNWFQWGGGANYFFEEFFPCVMTDAWTERFGKSGLDGAVPLSREDKMAFYQNSDRDQAVFLTEHFEKLVPSEWGLGQYDKDGKLLKTYHYPVWHRFTLAGDDTVIWVEPCAYCPSWFMGYHYDAQAGSQSSLGLETIPFQDHVGMILSQMVLTAKQNLINAIFYDENIVDRKDIEKLENKGERLYRALNFIGFDSLKFQHAGLSAERAFHPVQLTKQNIVELLQLLPMVLNIMERVLQISAQEVGAAASHQQGKEEILQTGAASTQGVTFTASYVDEGIDGWKRQLHAACLAYMDPDIVAEVSADVENLEQHLAELGFEKTDLGKGTVLVMGKKHKLRLEQFASATQSTQPGREKEMAQVVFGLIGTISGQPELFKKVGADNLLDILEQAAIWGGAPRGFKLSRIKEDETDQEVGEHIQQAIQMAMQAMMKALEEKQIQPIAQTLGQDQQRIEALEAMVKKMTPIFQMAQQAQNKDRLAAQAEQRKDVQTAAKVKREADKTQAEIEIARQKTAAEIEIAKQKAEGQLHIKTMEAAHGAAVQFANAKSEPSKSESTKES